MTADKAGRCKAICMQLSALMSHSSLLTVFRRTSAQHACRDVHCSTQHGSSAVQTLHAGDVQEKNATRRLHLTARMKASTRIGKL